MSDSDSPWPWVRLKDLAAEMCLGKMLDKAKNQGTPQPYLGNINVRWFSFNLNELKEMRFGDHELERFSVRPGDLVVCEGGEPGRSAVWTGQASRMMIQKALHRIRFPADRYDPRFAMYFLYYGSLTNRFAEFYTGTTIKHLTGTALAEVPFPCPPVREQRRIVEKIDELFSDLDASVASLKRAKANLKRYRASVLKAAVEGRLTEEWRKQHPQAEDGQMLLDHILRERREKWERDQLAGFADKGKEPPKNWQTKYELPANSNTSGLPTLPEEWIWTILDQIAPPTGGLTKNRNRDLFARTLPYLRVANVYSNDLRLSEIEEIGVDDSELQRLLLTSGDLLIVEGNGSKDQIGRVALWNASIDPCVHQNHIIKARPIKALGRWILHFLISPHGRRGIEQAASSTSGLYTLSIKKVAALAIPLPPLAEQEEVVRLVEERLSQIDAAEARIKAELIRSKKLRKGILKQAFEGAFA